MGNDSPAQEPYSLFQEGKEFSRNVFTRFLVPEDFSEQGTIFSDRSLGSVWLGRRKGRIRRQGIWMMGKGRECMVREEEGED